MVASSRYSTGARRNAKSMLFLVLGLGSQVSSGLGRTSPKTKIDTNIPGKEEGYALHHQTEKGSISIDSSSIGSSPLNDCVKGVLNSLQGDLALSILPGSDVSETSGTSRGQVSNDHIPDFFGVLISAGAFCERFADGDYGNPDGEGEDTTRKKKSNKQGDNVTSSKSIVNEGADGAGPIDGVVVVSGSAESLPVTESDDDSEEDEEVSEDDYLPNIVTFLPKWLTAVPVARSRDVSNSHRLSNVRRVADMWRGTRTPYDKFTESSRKAVGRDLVFAELEKASSVRNNACATNPRCHKQAILSVMGRATFDRISAMYQVQAKDHLFELMSADVEGKGFAYLLAKKWDQLLDNWLSNSRDGLGRSQVSSDYRRQATPGQDDGFRDWLAAHITRQNVQIREEATMRAKLDNSSNVIPSGSGKGGDVVSPAYFSGKKNAVFVVAGKQTLGSFQTDIPPLGSFHAVTYKYTDYTNPNKEITMRRTITEADFESLKEVYKRAGLRVMATAFGLESIMYGYARLLHRWDLEQTMYVLTDPEGTEKDAMQGVIPFLVSSVDMQKGDDGKVDKVFGEKGQGVGTALVKPPSSMAIEDFRNFIRLTNTGDLGLILAAEFQRLIYNQRREVELLKAENKEDMGHGEDHFLSPTNHVFYHYGAFVHLFTGGEDLDREIFYSDDNGNPQRSENPKRQFLHKLAQPLFLEEFLGDNFGADNQPSNEPFNHTGDGYNAQGEYKMANGVNGEPDFQEERPQLSQHVASNEVSLSPYNSYWNRRQQDNFRDRVSRKENEIGQKGYRGKKGSSDVPGPKLALDLVLVERLERIYAYYLLTAFKKGIERYSAENGVEDTDGEELMSVVEKPAKWARESLMPLLVNLYVQGILYGAIRYSITADIVNSGLGPWLSTSGIGELVLWAMENAAGAVKGTVTTVGSFLYKVGAQGKGVAEAGLEVGGSMAANSVPSLSGWLGGASPSYRILDSLFGGIKELSGFLTMIIPNRALISVIMITIVSQIDQLAIEAHTDDAGFKKACAAGVCPMGDGYAGVGVSKDNPKGLGLLANKYGKGGKTSKFGKDVKRRLEFEVQEQMADRKLSHPEHVNGKTPWNRRVKVSFDRKFSWFYRTVGRSLKGGAGRLLMCPFRGLDALGRGTKGFCKWVLDRPFLSFGTTTLAGKGLSKIGDTEMRIPFTDVGLGMRPSDAQLLGVTSIIGTVFSAPTFWRALPIVGKNVPEVYLPFIIQHTVRFGLSWSPKFLDHTRDKAVSAADKARRRWRLTIFSAFVVVGLYMMRLVLINRHSDEFILGGMCQPKDRAFGVTMMPEFQRSDNCKAVIETNPYYWRMTKKQMVSGASTRHNKHKLDMSNVGNRVGQCSQDLGKPLYETKIQGMETELEKLRQAMKAAEKLRDTMKDGLVDSDTTGTGPN